MTTGGQLKLHLINAAFIRAIDSCERSPPFENTLNASEINSYSVENIQPEC